MHYKSVICIPTVYKHWLRIEMVTNRANRK